MRAVYVGVMQVSFALFADAANLSQEGKLNILGVFDALQVATLLDVVSSLRVRRASSVGVCVLVWSGEVMLEK